MRWWKWCVSSRELQWTEDTPVSCKEACEHIGVICLKGNVLHRVNITEEGLVWGELIAVAYQTGDHARMWRYSLVLLSCIASYYSKLWLLWAISVVCFCNFILTGGDQILLKLMRDSHNRQNPSIYTCTCGVMWQIHGAKRMQLLNEWR